MDQDRKRKAVLKLLQRGLATQSEAARLADVSRQIIAYWVQQARIDPAEARESCLKTEWQRIIRV